MKDRSTSKRTNGKYSISELAILHAAVSIATVAHKGQFRRDGITPYIQHPKKTASFLGEDDIEGRAVAWLHDTLEDTQLTSDNLISKNIPKHLVDAIDILTKKPDQPYDLYLELVKMNKISRRVKIADMMANLSDNPTKKQINKYLKGLKFLLT